MSEFEEMLLLPKHLYDMILKHEDQAIREAATTINIKQLNNLDVHDNAGATINNDDNFLGVDKKNQFSLANNSLLRYQDDEVYPTEPGERFLPPSLITSTPYSPLNSLRGVRIPFQGCGSSGQTNNLSYNTNNLADRNVSNGQENPLLNLQSVLQQRLLSERQSSSSRPHIGVVEERLQRGEMFNALPDYLRNNSQAAFFPPPPVSQHVSAPAPPIYNPIFPSSNYQQQSHSQLQPSQQPPQTSSNVPQQNSTIVQQPPIIERNTTMNEAVSSTGIEPSNLNPTETVQENVNVDSNLVLSAAERRRERARRGMERIRRRNREADLVNARGRLTDGQTIATTEVSTATNAIMPSVVEADSNTSNPPIVEFPSSPSTQLTRRAGATFSFPTMTNLYQPQHSFISSNPRPVTQPEGSRFAIGLNGEDMSSALARITAIEPMENTVSSLNESIHTTPPSEDEQMLNLEQQPQRMIDYTRPQQQAAVDNNYSNLGEQYMPLALDNLSQQMLTNDTSRQLAIPYQSRDEENTDNALVPASQQFPVSNWSNLHRSLLNMRQSVLNNSLQARPFQSRELGAIARISGIPTATSTAALMSNRQPQLALPAPLQQAQVSSQQAQISHLPLLALPPPAQHLSNQSFLPSTPRETPNTSLFFNRESPPPSPVVSIPPPPQAYQQPVLPEVTDNERNVWRSFTPSYKRHLPKEPTVRLRRRKNIARKYIGVGNTEPTERHSRRSEDEEDEEQ